MGGSNTWTLVMTVVPFLSVGFWSWGLTTTAKMSSQHSYEVLEAAHPCRFQAVADAGRLDLAPYEARLLEDAQVFGHGRLAHRQPVDQVATHAGLPLGQQPEYLHANRMADRPGKTGQFLVGVDSRGQSGAGRREWRWTETGFARVRYFHRSLTIY